MTPEESQKLNAIFDAIFLETPTSRGTPWGLLRTLGAVYDGIFKKDSTSYGTPGGVLTSLGALIARDPAVPTIDVAALAAALAPQISGVTAEELAALLQPEFDKIHANINDQPTDFRIVPA